MRLAVKGRLRELLELTAKVFEQPETGVATPMGIDNDTCRTIALLSRSLLSSDEVELTETEVRALLCGIQLARRNLIAEFSLEMQELQKVMTAVATAQTTAEILKQSARLPVEAEKAARGLENMVKGRGMLLNEATAFIKKLKARLTPSTSCISDV